MGDRVSCEPLVEFYAHFSSFVPIYDFHLVHDIEGSNSSKGTFIKFMGDLSNIIFLKWQNFKDLNVLYMVVEKGRK